MDSSFIRSRALGDAGESIAMSKFRRRELIVKLVLKVCALSTLFFTLSRSFTVLPASAKLSGKFSSQLQAVFDNRLCVLWIIIGLIGAISCLYRRNDDDSGVRSPDCHHEFAVHSIYSQSMVVGGGVYPETAALDYVTAEKSISMSKFRRHELIVKLILKACALSTLFFTLSRSFPVLPVAAKLSGEFSRQLLAVFDNRLCVLWIIIGLIGAIPCLYLRNNDDSGVRSPDCHREFAVHSVYSQSMVVVGGMYPETATAPYCRTVVVDEVEHPETETTPEEDKQMVCADNDEGVTETKSSCVIPPVRAITGTKCTENDVALVEKPYRRTRSESFEKNLVVEKSESSKRVMQRSETEIIHLKMVSCRKESARRSSSVEELNDEEVNNHEQKIIYENKMKLKQQKAGIEREEIEREECRREEEEEEEDEEEEGRKREELNLRSQEFIKKMKIIHQEDP